MSIERLRALEKDIRNSGGPGCQYHADQLATLIAELGQEVGAVADEYGWVEGPPHRILSKEEGEWFIAETTYGDRVVLKGLPEEYAYDFTTADSTYWKRECIKRWRQFPDSEYKPLGVTSPAHASEAGDAELLDWLRVNEFDLVTRREDIGEDEYAIWWFVVDYRKSTRTNLHTVSGHPLGSPREAIIAAMERQNEGAT